MLSSNTTPQVVTDPQVKSDLQQQMLGLVAIPLHTFSEAEAELYGSSAKKPIVMNSDSDEADETIRLDSDVSPNKNVKEEPGVDSPAVVGCSSSSWANQVTSNPNPNPKRKPNPNCNHHRYWVT